MKDDFSIETLLHEEESTTLDFKRESYKFSGADEQQKSELLKDILAFANAWRRTDAYILTGVQEVKGERSIPVGIQEEFDLDDSRLQQFINEKTNRPIEFSYQTFLVEGKKIGVFKIPVQKRPLFLKKAYGKLSENTVYIRRGSSTAIANPDEIHHMGIAEHSELQEIPALHFEFADLRNRTHLGTTLDLTLTLLTFPDEEDIPSFYEERSEPNVCYMDDVNHNYYREYASFDHVAYKSKQLNFLLQNDSAKVVSDIRVELKIEKVLGDKFTFFKTEHAPKRPQPYIKRFQLPQNMNMSQVIQEALKNNNHFEIKELKDFYRIIIPFEKVQPKQTIFAVNSFIVSAEDDFSATIDVMIYADNIPEPVKQCLKLTCKMIKKDVPIEWLLNKTAHIKRSRFIKRDP